MTFASIGDDPPRGKFSSEMAEERCILGMPLTETYRSHVGIEKEGLCRKATRSQTDDDGYSRACHSHGCA